MSPVVRSVLSGITWLALTAATAAAQTTVVDFEVGPTNLPAMRTALRGGEFGGIRWDIGSGWSVGSWNIPSLNNTVQCRSGIYCASPNRSNPDGTSTGVFEFITPSRFVGLWLSGPAWVDGTPPGSPGTIPNRVAAELWFEGAIVNTTAFLDVVPDPQFLGVTYGGPVDQVRLVGQPAATVIDDITYATYAAPEPATFVLAASGLALVAGWHRRRRA